MFCADILVKVSTNKWRRLRRWYNRNPQYEFSLWSSYDQNSNPSKCLPLLLSNRIGGSELHIRHRHWYSEICVYYKKTICTSHFDFLQLHFFTIGKCFKFNRQVTSTKKNLYVLQQSIVVQITRFGWKVRCGQMSRLCDKFSGLGQSETKL